jgi:hypothetical protein
MLRQPEPLKSLPESIPLIFILGHNHSSKTVKGCLQRYLCRDTTTTRYSSKLIFHNTIFPQIVSFSKEDNTILPQIVSFSKEDNVHLINLELKQTYFFSHNHIT